MSGDGVADKGCLDPTDDAFVDIVSDLLSRGHSVRFRAKGGSMHPTIREGEAITVTPARPAAIRRGDVVLYRSARGVIAHRVARVSQKLDGALMFIPRGDASPSRDDPVEEGAILGRVVTVERSGHALDPAALRARTVAVAWAAAAHLMQWLRARRSRPT
jgi:signal peptidase I